MVEQWACYAESLHTVLCALHCFYPVSCFTSPTLFPTMPTVLYPEYCFVSGISRSLFRAKRRCAVSLAGTPSYQHYWAKASKGGHFYQKEIGLHPYCKYSGDATYTKVIVPEKYQTTQKSGSQSDAFYPGGNIMTST